MYGWLWRQLPGPVPVRVLAVLAIAALVVVACFGWVFPTLGAGLLGDRPGI